MTPFSSSTFWVLFVIFIFVFEKYQNSFSLGRTFGPFWSVKYLSFWRWNLWDQNFVPLDSGNIHIKESKEPGFTFSIELRTKFVWSHDVNDLKNLFDTTDLMIRNCICGMVDQRTFSLVSSQDHCQRSSPFRISDTPRAGFERAQNLSSGFVEWSYAVVIIFIIFKYLWRKNFYRYFDFRKIPGNIPMGKRWRN